MTVLRTLYVGKQVLECPAVRANPGAHAFCKLLVDGAPRPLGALTLVYEDAVLQFGAPTEESARLLAGSHRAQRLAPASAGEASAGTLGFDLAHPDLGLPMERNRRFAMPGIRDRNPGEWVHPVVLVKDAAFFVRTLAQRNLGLGESFLAGEFEMLRGGVHHMLQFFLVNRTDRGIQLPAAEAAKLFWHYIKWRASVSHNELIADHYDVGDNIFVPMLGATGLYSCGYMQGEDDDLERMQLNKMNLVFSKMRLEPGMRILDTGCGNGSMLVHAALSWGCEGEGFTNSFNMASLGRRNAEVNGVADRVRIHNADFSILKTYPDGHFDAIYEVAAWEHLPFHTYEAVMRECWRILKPHGRMLVHSLGNHEDKHVRDGYVQKYVFQDSNQLRLHLLLDASRKHDFFVADVENLVRHYYWTLWYWRRNLVDAYEADPTIRERDFRVMLYFLECAMGEGRFGDGSVYQVLLFRDVRDYLVPWRVDGRMHDPERGAIREAPLLLRPFTQHEHLNNTTHADGKREQPVYRHSPAGLWRLMRDLVDTARRARHQ